MTFNLLDTGIIPIVDDEKGRREVTLPELFAFYASGGEAQIAGMRPHQEFSVYSTLAQLAAASVLSAGRSEIPTSASEWRDILGELVARDGWEILQEDPTKPGFMQPPMDAGTFETIREEKVIEDPARMGVLFVSKNHVEKSYVHESASPWAWAVALMSAQTSLGYGGVGNYGILRMNGGLGSRPFTALYGTLSHGHMWRRDVAWMISNVERIVADHPFYRSDGLVALWAVPWDGKTQIGLGELHPLFVDVARRYRVIQRDGRLLAAFANSEGYRVADLKGKDEDGGKAMGIGGKTGDPWAPISLEKNGVLTLQGSGWTYGVVADLLFGVEGKIVPPPLLVEPSVMDDDCVAVFSVLVGGQGETDGYHRREVAYPREVARDFLSDFVETKATLASHSKGMIQDAGGVAKTLRTAVAAYGTGEFDFGEIEWDAPKVKRSLALAMPYFDKAVDERFFPCLFETYRSGDREEWRGELRRICTDTLDMLSAKLVLPNGVRSRSRAAGENVLIALWQKNLNPPKEKAA